MRTHADFVAVQIFISAPRDSRSLELLARAVDAVTGVALAPPRLVPLTQDLVRHRNLFLPATPPLSATRPASSHPAIRLG